MANQDDRVSRVPTKEQEIFLSNDGQAEEGPSEFGITRATGIGRARQVAAANRAALEFQLGQLIERAHKALRASNKFLGSGDGLIGPLDREQQQQPDRESAADEQYTGAKSFASGEQSPPPPPPPPSATIIYQRQLLDGLSGGGEGEGEQAKLLPNSNPISAHNAPGAAFVAQQKRELKRRASMTEQVKRFLEAPRLQSPSYNAIQSLASSLMTVDDMTRVYKPRVISTARGFGKRSDW